MKKQLLVLISSLLFLAIGFSGFAQNISGGKIDAKDAKILKQMEKALEKGDVKRFNVLKAGRTGRIECLDTIFCGGSSAVELIPNVGIIYPPAIEGDNWNNPDSVIWTVKSYKNFTATSFPPSLQIIDIDINGKWFFHPDRVPDSMAGEFLQFDASVEVATDFFVPKRDWAYFYPKPIEFNIVSTSGALCDGDPYNIVLDGSTDSFLSSVGTSVKTYYYLYKNGKQTSDSIEGTGSPIQFTVTDSATYTIAARGLYDYSKLNPKPYYPPCEVFMKGSNKVTVNSLPDISDAKYNKPLCEDKTLILTASTVLVPSTFVWTDVNGWSDVGGSVSRANITIAQGGFYTLTATSENGCVSDSVIDVVVNPLPLITLDGPVNPCMNNLTGDEYTTETGMSSYVWTFPGATVNVDYKIVSPIVDNDTIYVNWLTPGAKTIAVNYSTVPAGCTATSAKTLPVNVSPLPLITTSNTIANQSCLNTPVNYSTASGMSGYNWVITQGVGTITPASQNTATANVIWSSVAPAGKITVSYTNTFGCTSTSKPYDVTINPLPAVTAVATPNSVCAGSAVALTGNPVGLTSYSWSSSGTDLITNSSARLTSINNPSASADYILVGIDNKGCANSDTVTLVVNPIPVVSLTGEANPCMNNVSPGDEYVTDAGNSAYSWTFPGSTLNVDYSIVSGAGNDTIYVNWKTSGVKTIAVNYVKSGCSAASPKQMTVTVSPLPTITTSNIIANESCLNTPVTYNTQTGMSGYNWVITQGVGTITPASKNTDAAVVTWSSLAPAGKITVTYTNPLYSCSSTSLPYNVAINALPNVTITSALPNPVCKGSQVTLTGNPVGLKSYTWSSDVADVISSPNTRVATVNSPTINGQYVLSGVDNKGCANSDTVDLVVSSLPTPTIISPSTLSPVCQDEFITYKTQGAPNSGWNWTIQGGKVQGVEDGRDSVIVKWDDPAVTNSISVSYSNGSCVGTSAVTPINVLATPVPTLTPSAAVCANSTQKYSTDLAMKAGSYLWTITGGVISSGQGTYEVVVVWGSGVPAASLSVSYVNPAGCPSAIKKNNYLVNALPVPVITPVSPDACKGIPKIYTTTAGMQAGSYVWTTTSGGTLNGSVPPFTNTQSVTWNNVGSLVDTVSVTYIDGNGCAPAAPTKKAVNVLATPTLNIKPNPATPLCVGQTGNYATKSGQSNYTWVVVNGTILTPAPLTNKDNIDVKWNAGATHSVSVNYTENQCPAPSAFVLPVTVNDVPTPTLTDLDLKSTECIGTTRNYTTQTGGGIYGWVWGIIGSPSAHGSINSTTNNQIQVDWSSASLLAPADTIVFNYFNAAGCSAPVPGKYAVKIEALPTPTLTNNPSPKACVGSTVTYTTQLGMKSYDWNVSAGGAIISGENTSSCTVQWNTAGSETVSVTYSSVAGNCPAANYFDFVVTVNDLPTTPINGQSNVCTSSRKTYKAPAGSSGWNWVITGGAVVTVGPVTDSIQVDWPSTVGIGNVRLTYTDTTTKCTSVPLDLPITVALTSTPSISGSISVCQGFKATYRTQSSMSGYVWTVNGGSISSAQGLDSMVVTWNTAGLPASNNISVIYTDPTPGSCPVVASLPYGVTVSALPSNEIITGNSIACLSDTITYSIPAGYSNIIWSTNNGTPIGVTNNNLFDVKWNSAVLDTVKVVYTNLSGCAPSTLPTLPVSVSNLPSPTLISNDTIVCFGETGVYTTDVVPTGGYVWTVNNGLILSGANSNRITVVWSVPALTHSVEVNYPNANGCYALKNKVRNVVVNDLPKPIISGPLTACINKSGQLYQTSNSAGVGGWAWSITGGTIDGPSNTANVSVTWTSTTLTSLTVSYTENKCVGTSQPYDVTVSNLPVPQTAITFPNGEYCANETGVGVRLSAAELSVSYELRNALNAIIGSAVTYDGVNPVEWTGVLAGTYYVIGSAPSACSDTVAKNIVVTVNPLPVEYTVTPAGPVTGCNGGAGYDVGLNNSDTGVTYELLLNNVVVDTPEIGTTGNAIHFGEQLSYGTYKVRATNNVTGCVIVTSSSFVMNSDVITTAFDLIADPASGSFCDIVGGGVDISLSDSELGVDYILKTADVDVDTVAGSGNLINFARVNVSGDYSIGVPTASGCRAPMNGGVTVTPITPPTQMNVVANDGGFFCSGAGGNSIDLVGQQVGVDYELFAIGNIVPLDTISGIKDDVTYTQTFSGLYPIGDYYVLAHKILATGCSIAMLDTVTLSANPLPATYIVSSDGDFCIGDSTNITLSASQSTVQYRVVNVDDNSTSAWIPGLISGGSVSFSVKTSGNYTIEASQLSNGITCSSWMQDTVTVTAQSLPSDVSVVTSGGTSCNDGIVITIKSSQSPVVYTVIDQTLGTSPVTSIIGDGNDISFDPIIDNGKIYDIHATLNGCDVIVGTPISVNVSGVITKQLVTGGGSICSGGSASIGLGDTEDTYQYTLYLADSPGGASTNPPVASLVGDGLRKIFGASISANGEYYVVGTSGSCVNEMANRVNVVLNAPIVPSILLAPNDTVCENSSVLFTARGGNRYTFYFNNSSLGMAADSTLLLASVFDQDQIKVFVEDSVTGCSAMSGTTTLTVINELTQFTLQSVSGGLICPAKSDSLYLNSSEIGVNYILYNQLDAPVDTIAGNNGLIYFSGIATGSYYVIAELIGGSPCGVKAMNDTIVVALAPSPTVYNLSPNGSENGCLGGNITLDGSDAGLTYQLLRNGVVIADTIGQGSGIGVSFVKPLVAGTYTINALYGNGCTELMNGSLQIINPPTENIYMLTANPVDGRYCNNGSSVGVALSLSNSDIAKTYSLMRGTTSILDTTITIAGTLSFGTFTTAGYYSVQVASTNGCFDVMDMDSVIHIVPVLPPTAFSLQADNDGSYCTDGGSGVRIQLVGQQDDVIYELFESGVHVGSAIGIDSNASSILPFTNILNNSYLFSIAGTYSAVAHYLSPTGCDQPMSSTVDVIPTPNPMNFIVTSAGDFCEGSSTVINLNGSEVSVDYRWVNITTTDKGSWNTTATGGLLQFSNITIPGDYVVEARSKLGAGCTVTMADTVTIMEVQIPHVRNYSVDNGTTCSEASLIIVENAEQGVLYTLVDFNTNVPTSISFVGNANQLDTMQIVDANGKYFIRASRLNCSITFPSSPSYIDINNPDPSAVKKHIVTPVDASICNGDFGVKFGLQTNTLGVKYTLYWSLDNIKDAVPQDTIDSFVGNGGLNQQFKKLGKKPGFYYVYGENSTCSNYMTNDPELIVNPLPIAFNVTGSGMYCDPDPDPSVGGALIGVEEQQDRVLYTLQQYDSADNYVDDISEFRGSLSALPFVFGSYKENALNNDFYKVVAIDTITGCTSNMSGVVEVKLTPFTPDLPIVNLGVSNGRYCQGTNGAPIIIDAPQVGLTYQIVQEKLPVDTVLIEKIAVASTPLTLGFIELGNYHVVASWGGDACAQSSAPFIITERIPIPFNVDFDCGVTDTSAISEVINAGHITMDSSEIGVTYLVYDALSNVVGFNNGIDTAMTFTGLFGPGVYSVKGTCSASATPISMLNDVTISFPISNIGLTIKDRNTLIGVRGDTIQLNGYEDLNTYYSRIENWVDTFLIADATIPPPLNFPTDSSGVYHVLAINDHNCGSIITTQATILESVLVAINDTLNFGENDLIGKSILGYNDLLDRDGIDKEGVDGNIVYRIIRRGINTDIRLDSITGEFTYTKSPTFYGKDSVSYELVNTSIFGRRDTAQVIVFIGNKPGPLGNTFLIPNAFSPNNDGVNDYFVITTRYLSYATEESELEVYNRWGSLVYRSKDKSYDNKWNGIANANMISVGDELPNGTYFYIFKVTFNVNGVLNKEEYNGFIELRR